MKFPNDVLDEICARAGADNQPVPLESLAEHTEAVAYLVTAGYLRSDGQSVTLAGGGERYRDAAVRPFQSPGTP